MSELKNCPFCGRFIGHSDDCWVSMVLNHYDFGVNYSVDEINEAWNKRAERTCKWKSRGDLGGYVGECGSMMMNMPNHCPGCGAKVVE